MRTIFFVFFVQIIFISFQFWRFSTSVEFDLYETNMRESFQELLALKSIKEPYKKFYTTFANLSVCSLRKAQKIKLCDQLMKHPDTSWMALNADNYENYRCSRIEFVWPVPSTNDVSPDEISAAPCPPLSTAEDRPYDAQGPSTLLYFVASSAEPKKVLFFARYDVNEAIYSAGMAYDIDVVCALRDEKSNCADKAESSEPEGNNAESSMPEEDRAESNKPEGNKAEGHKDEENTIEENK